jgi:GNAT superfamily N-acetyltransferase
MPAPDLQFRTARPEDIPSLIDLLSEAAAWARRRGVERWWPTPFPEAWVRPAVERGDTVVIEVGGRPVGTLTLTRDDRRMWGEQPPVAGYVHRMAVARRLAHQGLGARALDWAALEVVSWGRSKLRLDCLATNAPLVAHYVALGFREVGRVAGNIPGEDRPSLLMERPVRAGRTGPTGRVTPAPERDPGGRGPRSTPRARRG